MSLLPDSASFFEEVQAFFLECRGDGVALSDADARLLVRWEESGASSEAVIRGIRNALTRHTFDGKLVTRPRSLRSCRKEVEAEIQKSLAARAGKNLSAKRPSELPCPSPHADEASVHVPALIAPKAKAATAAAHLSLKDRAAAYAQKRLDDAKGEIDRLSLELSLSEAQRASLLSLVSSASAEAPGASEAIRRAKAGAFVFALRNAPFEVRTQAARRARTAASAGRGIESPRALAASLYRALVKEAEAIFSDAGKDGAVRQAEPPAPPHQPAHSE